ncbi:hypothetical protein BOX15_Mlig031737g1 [Macrostomum lignano]|uniref:Uncharacterized protein n=2 Tax=Macrostomum lignano TaxID=282301 RepID=A0A267H8M8_9PLAT|nr:hypothetical protein BOX15_Mlig031737g1 [Macrostomum lignano]
MRDPSKRKFIDSLRVFIKSGNGGPGNPGTRSIGGSGGSVIFEGCSKVNLRHLLSQHPDKRFIAGHGYSGSRRRLIGESGADRLVRVPVGVDIVTDDRRLVGRIDSPGQRLVVAPGGEGGRPSNRYLGAVGTAMSVRVDLRLLADYGFVGFPNAGKSSLMCALSKLKPKVANYPFTTLSPSIGRAVFEDKRAIALADLPGLIEGAHVNVGLGHHFLKHVERTTYLLFVVDVFGFKFNQNCPYRSGLETILLLNRELELYDPDLVRKPALAILNKIDKPGGRDCADEVTARLNDLTPDSLATEFPAEIRPNELVKFDEVIAVSAKERINTDYLKQRLRYWLDKRAEEQQRERMRLAAARLDTKIARANQEAVDSFV